MGDDTSKRNDLEAFLQIDSNNGISGCLSFI